MINYRAIGNGPPIVFLSGWGFHSNIFLNFVNELKVDFCCYLIDYPNSVKSWLLFLNEFENWIPTNAHVVGWSLGGSIANHCITTRVDLKGLWLLNSNPCFIANEHWPGMAQDRIQQLKLDLQRNPKKALLRFCFELIKTNPKKKQLYLLLTNYLLKNTSVKSLLFSLALLEEIDTSKQNNLTCNVHHFFSILDCLIPSDLQAMIPNSISVPVAGHAAFLFEPKFINVLSNKIRS